MAVQPGASNQAQVNRFIGNQVENQYGDHQVGGCPTSGRRAGAKCGLPRQHAPVQYSKEVNKLEGVSLQV